MSRKDLPPEIVNDIQRILNLKATDEQLDMLGNFTAVDTINKLFPNEEALGRISEVQNELKQQQIALQAEINTLHLELQSAQDPSHMQALQELISELLSQMNRIREKATESEAIVQNITREIQVLDMAKRNLTLTVTALKRLQMMDNAISQLDQSVHHRNYLEISQTLSAMKEISSFFKGYSGIPRITAFWKQMQSIQGQLRTCLDEDFNNFFLQDPQKAINSSVISDACLVVDVLGEDVRKHFIDRYCSVELKEYRRIFRASDEAGQLDNVSRRFAWFRRQLALYDEDHAKIFPESWDLGQHLCARFSGITKDDLTAALAKAAPSLSVAQLLESMQLTLDFENSIAAKYNLPFAEIVKKNPSPIKTAKISSAFEQHLSIFVDAQDKALSDMLAPSRAAKSIVSSEITSGEAATVLPSSTELFYFYGQNLEQCAKFSTQKPLLDLCNVHKKWLRIYCDEVLAASLKRGDRDRKSMDGRFASMRNACIILNTADYCHSTALELEDKIKEKISDDLREQITLQAERDQFLAVISAVIISILRELETGCDPGFLAMSRSSWGNVVDVSGPSPYVSDLVTAIEGVVEVVREDIGQKKYLRNFYDKASNLLLTRFTNCMVKSRPLKETGAEQILLDLQLLKTCILRFPQALEGSVLSASFTRSVTKSTTNLETLLKAINVPADPAEGFIRNYTLLIGDSSFSNFQKVLDLKGLQKAQQNNLLDSFLTITSTMTDLDASSFLSTLDMDPPVTSILASTAGGLGVLSPNGSSTSLPAILGAGASSAGGVFSGLVTPPLGSSTPTGTESPRGTEGKREVLSDLRRLVTFAVRRERELPSS